MGHFEPTKTTFFSRLFLNILILLPNNPSPLFLEPEAETVAGQYNVHVIWSVHLLINIADPRGWTKNYLGVNTSAYMRFMNRAGVMYSCMSGRRIV